MKIRKTPQQGTEMQFNRTYIPDEASSQVNKPTEQTKYNEVLLQYCSAFPDCLAALQTLLQRECVEMQFNQTYVPDEASVQVNELMDQIHYNQMPLQNCSPIPDCPPALEPLLQGESVEMQFNQTYVHDEATLEVKTHMDQIHYNQLLLQNFSAIPDCPSALEKQLQSESVEQFQQDTEKTKNYLYSKGHRSSGMSLTNRREKNRERERKRQTRLKGAFNVLRSVIPDYFSEREPGDRLSRIQTLRMAKKYIASLQELLETC